jgi:hypothetical protein
MFHQMMHPSPPALTSWFCCFVSIRAHTPGRSGLPVCTLGAGVPGPCADTQERAWAVFAHQSRMPPPRIPVASAMPDLGR